MNFIDTRYEKLFAYMCMTQNFDMIQKMPIIWKIYKQGNIINLAYK
jgi:hypothetical protein